MRITLKLTIVCAMLMSAICMPCCKCATTWYQHWYPHNTINFTACCAVKHRERHKVLHSKSEQLTANAKELTFVLVAFAEAPSDSSLVRFTASFSSIARKTASVSPTAAAAPEASAAWTCNHAGQLVSSACTDRRCKPLSRYEAIASCDIMHDAKFCCSKKGYALCLRPVRPHECSLMPRFSCSDM